MTEQGVRPARGRLSPGTKRRFPCVEARVRTFRRGRGREARGRGKKPNTKTKRSLTVCIIDALKKSRAPRHMCPSPAAVRRYPNVTLMAPGCGCNPFAAEAVTSLFEQQNWKFRRQKTLSTAGRAASNLHSAPRAQHVFCTQVGGSWPGPHRSTKEESIRIINQFLRRTAAIVSRGGKPTTTQRMATQAG